SCTGPRHAALRHAVRGCSAGPAACPPHRCLSLYPMDISALQRLLEQGRDSALLRFGLGKALLDAGDTAEAVIHLQRCVAQDPRYSAGWKWLGKAQLAAGD